MTFALAHLSDVHVGPLVQPRWGELMGKRMTGYWNWKRHRHSIHNMDALADIIADIRHQVPDHIALTGDLVNLGMRSEFPMAARHLTGLGDKDLVSIIPGNHDAYAPGSLDMMRDVFGPYMIGDDGHPGFPYLRVRDDVALIGVSSAIVTLPFIADGAIGRQQLLRLDAMLAKARRQHAAVVIMIHHPPHKGGATIFRGLRDAPAFEAILARHGADLVIHGHNHKKSVTYRPGPNGTQVPIVGVASGSAVPGDPEHRAAYHLYRIDCSGPVAITMEVRGKKHANGPVTLNDTVALSRTA